MDASATVVAVGVFEMGRLNMGAWLDDCVGIVCIGCCIGCCIGGARAVIDDGKMLRRLN